MVTIKYYNGTTMVELDVSEEFAKQYEAMNERDAKVERRETRRHQSFEQAIENGHEFVDEAPSPEESLICLEDTEKLRAALSILSDKQRDILLSLALYNETYKEVADRYGISKQSVFVYFERARKKILTFWQKGV